MEPWQEQPNFKRRDEYAVIESQDDRNKQLNAAFIEFEPATPDCVPIKIGAENAKNL